MVSVPLISKLLMGPVFILVAGICLLIWPPAFKSRLFNRLPGILVLGLGLLLLIGMIEQIPTYQEHILPYSFSLSASQ